MMKWSVGTKIGAGYALALALLMVLGAVSYRSASEFVGSSKQTVHTFVVLDTLARVLSDLQDAETGQRGFVITGKDSYLLPYHNGVADLGQRLAALRTLTADNPNQQRRLQRMAPLVASKLAELKETIDLRRNQGFQAALQVVQTNAGKKEMDEMRQILAAMKTEEERLRAQRDDRMSASAQSTIGVITYGVPLAVLLLAVIGFGVSRQITRQLRDGASRIATASSEILTTTTQVAAGASETATAVSQTTATVEEVKQTALMAGEKAKNVSDSAQTAAQISRAGRESVEEAIGGMRRVEEQMGSVGESIVRLSEQSQAIGEIIATVNDLSEQSNLLAVNAAIEAAKVGEQGKGFGVVAQEVRNLAEQSKQATAQVRAILGDIQKATGAAVMAAEQGAKAVEVGVRQSTQAGESIRKLSESVDKAAQAATQIAASSQQQIVGMDQIALAMDNIKQASLQNVAGVKQTEAAAQNLHELGQALNALIGGARNPSGY